MISGPPGSSDGWITVFPPSDHEGLETHPTNDPLPPPPVSSAEPWARRALGLGFGVVREWVLEYWRWWGVWLDWRAAFWVMALALACARYRFRKERRRLRVLVDERDQKINQLLRRMAELNETLSVKHKVSVLRQA